MKNVACLLYVGLLLSAAGALQGGQGDSSASSSAKPPLFRRRQAAKADSKGADTQVAQLPGNRTASDKDGRTPLYRAAIEGDCEKVAQLLVAGAPIDQGNTLGWTPLQAAVNQGHEDVVPLLLIAENARSNAGTGLGSILLAEVGKGQWASAAIVTALLIAGADPLYRKEGGSTARELAEKAGNKEMAADLSLAEEICEGQRKVCRGSASSDTASGEDSEASSSSPD